jgi:hypothetical protein
VVTLESHLRGKWHLQALQAAEAKGTALRETVWATQRAFERQLGCYFCGIGTGTSARAAKEHRTGKRHKEVMVMRRRAEELLPLLPLRREEDEKNDV